MTVAELIALLTDTQRFDDEVFIDDLNVSPAVGIQTCPASTAYDLAPYVVIRCAR